MAVLSELVKSIAAVEGLEETQVAWVARHLREAGFIAQGGRGRGGAQMTTADATNLIIGLNAASSAKDAARAVSELRLPGKIDDLYGMSPELADESGLFRALCMPNNPASCIEALLDCFRSTEGREPELTEDNSPHISISFSRPILRMELRVEEKQQSNDELPDLIAFIGFEAESISDTDGDRSDRTTITEKTLAAVGRTLGN